MQLVAGVHSQARASPLMYGMFVVGSTLHWQPLQEHVPLPEQRRPFTRPHLESSHSQAGP